jgi:hypothetical protein
MSGGYQGQQQQELSEAVQDRHQQVENFWLLSVGHDSILPEEMTSVPKGYCGSA